MYSQVLLILSLNVLAPLDYVSSHEFVNKQGKKVRYRVYLRGATLPNIVISPVQSEPMKKYFESDLKK